MLLYKENDIFSECYSYKTQTLVVNEIFPPVIPDAATTDDDDEDDRSDASRSPDEGITSDEELQFGALEE